MALQAYNELKEIFSSPPFGFSEFQLQYQNPRCRVVWQLPSVNLRVSVEPKIEN